MCWSGRVIAVTLVQEAVMTNRTFAAALRFSAAVFAALTVQVYTQGEVVDPATKTLPNPNPKVVKNWGELPNGRMWGSTAGGDIGPDGNVWAYDRCGTNTCADSKVDPIVKFDRNTGKLL